jgi:hypothetical protein
MQSLIPMTTALCQANSHHNERNARRAALREDVRNWNLDSGYALDISFDEQVTLHVLHNWVHFAHLWKNEREPMAQLRGF